MSTAIHLHRSSGLSLHDALTPGAVVYDLVGKDIAVNAKVLFADFARVAPAFADSLRRRPRIVLGLLRGPVFGLLGKRREAGETVRRLGRVSPRDLYPVTQRKEVMVRPGQVGGEDESETTARAFCRQAAHPSTATRAQVAFSKRLVVTGTVACGAPGGQFP